MAESQSDNTDATNAKLAELAGSGWNKADVDVLDERLPVEQYHVDDVTFTAGPRDDRPGRNDHGDGRHLDTSSEGSSTVKRFAVDELIVEIETDSQPGATSPRLRVTEQEA